MLLFFIASCSVVVRAAYRLLVERRLISDIIMSLEEEEQVSGVPLHLFLFSSTLPFAFAHTATYCVCV